jgi:hypothetical protein
VDLFATTNTTTVPGAFFSQYACVGSLGSPMMHPWDKVPGTEQQMVAWVQPPYSMIGRVLRKMIVFRLDGLLIVPVWPRGWRALLHELPVVARRRLEGCHWQAGAHVPSRRVGKAPKYAMDVLCVQW